MVFGVLALLVMAMFTLPKLVSPAAESQTIWKVGVAILLLASFSWLLFGQSQLSNAALKSTCLLFVLMNPILGFILI